MQVDEIVPTILFNTDKTTYHIMRIPLQFCVNKGVRQRLPMISSKADARWIILIAQIACIKRLFCRGSSLNKYRQCCLVLWVSPVNYHVGDRV